jgi:rubredoxin
MNSQIPTTRTLPIPSETFSSTTSLPITRDSDEWGVAEAFLQLVYRTSNVSLRSLWTVSNPALLARFERRARDAYGIFPTVVAAEDISSNITLGSICDKGYPDIAEGVRVKVGNVPLPTGYLNAGTDGTRKQGRGRRMFEVLICRVIVGKSYVMDEQETKSDITTGRRSGIEELSPDYDSILIRPGPHDGEMHALTVSAATPSSLTKGYLPPHTFCQSYILRNGDQVLPMFVCRFEIDTDKDEPLALIPCQNCDANAATIWCAADSAALCPDCDESHHSVNRLTQRHIRVPINERPRESGPCAIRADLPAELWSDNMGIAVSKETQKEHFPTTKFDDIADSYKSSIRLARREDDDFEAIKENLLSRIKAQDESIGMVERMFSDAEELTYRKIADALQRALQITEKKISILIDEEKKIQEKVQFLQWSEELLQPYAHVTPPPEWLDLWLTHYRMVRQFILKPSDDQQHGDEEIKLTGHLTVKEEQKRIVALQ